MADYSNLSGYTGYNTKQDYSYLFAGMSTAGTGATAGNSNLLADYASIKNGSYGKLMKAYFAMDESEGSKTSSSTSSSAKTEASQKQNLMKSNADAMKKSAEALQEESLWEQETVTKKDEKTGEEIATTEYKWDEITKEVKAFIEDYNSVIKEAAESDTKSVLRNAAWLTGMTEEAGDMLKKVGITIGKGNELELDEDAIKKANINTLKNMFTGHNSFASKVAQKASAISNAVRRASGGYTSSGGYVSDVFSGAIDKGI